jgi:outer membrane protein assembly factor BamD
MIFRIILIIFCVFTFSCSKKKPEPIAETDYIKAYEILKDGSYNEAGKAFEKIEDDYPFSKWAPKAHTMAVYAYYKNEDYDDVERVVDDFIRINPNNDDVDYMIYMKAMSYFVRIPDIYRAQDDTKKASATFRELRARFLESEYSVDAAKKLKIVDEHIAGAQMSVGRYQILQENYVGAIKNFQEIIWRYKRTNQAPEAYYRLFEIYNKIGLTKEAQKAYIGLFTDFSQNEWTKMAQKLQENIDKNE